MKLEMKNYELPKEVRDATHEMKMREFIKFLKSKDNLSWEFLNRLDNIVSSGDKLASVTYTYPAKLDKCNKSTLLMLKFDRCTPILSKYKSYELTFVIIIEDEDRIINYTDHIVMDNRLWQKFRKYIYGIFVINDFDF